MQETDKLSIVSILNAQGRIVTPSLNSVSNSLAAVDKTSAAGPLFNASLLNQCDNCWQICSVTYLGFYDADFQDPSENCVRRTWLYHFLRWFYTNSDLGEFMEDLG